MRDFLPIAAMLGLLLAGSGAHAQSPYPTKPVRLIVPFPAGGQTDIITRTFALKLTEAFNQPVVVDNRPGAGGTIGAEIAVKASPRRLLARHGVGELFRERGALQAALRSPEGCRAGHHDRRDPQPGHGPSVRPREEHQGVIAYAKANPGKLNYGSGGTGSGVHLATVLFNQMTGTQMTHVPYKGATASVSDLISGQIQLVFGGLPGMVPHVKAGRLRGLAVTSAKRSNTVPDMPTVAETVPGYEAVSWAAVLGPKGLPKDVVARWNRELNRTLQLPDVKERMAADGLEIVGGSPERFREILASDIERWQKVVKASNIKLGG